ncbi:PEP/pyruvate-binding domain-containing protein [Eubacterium sp. ER2]|uniref:PEP/pyruvate-binding domain-containing protein n=1 Tax=Eubacterium sp. ER2 TaxID=1519438 RepID=UPI000ABD12AE|nr:PEP/pyruvate-binding domain-containing protein [Eubacterium sp. ER2]
MGRQGQNMSAFDRILSGFPDVDRLLDNIRLGDNVVWRVKSLDQFRYFAEPFAERAIADGRTTVYMKFAGHEPLLAPRPGLKIREFDPDKGFEAFTVDIYNCITENGREAFYVFDSLSALQSVWYTDLMMGNFFRVTCPYLFRLDTVAYFPLLRGRHSFDAVARIRDTTQVFLDVYRGDGFYYLHPLKVWNRYSAKMFLPHACDPGKGTLKTVEDGVALSRYYRILEEEELQEMLLARKIVRKELPGCGAYLEPHDSFYIGSDVFYTYIVSNSCWELRIAQRTQEGYFSRSKELREALLAGEFPPNIREKFRSILEYFGQSPIIVRSSSFLEDGFGDACADTGLMRETERRDRYGNDYGNAGGAAAQGPSGPGAQGGSAGHQGGGRSPGGLLPEVPGAGI